MIRIRLNTTKATVAGWRIIALIQLATLEGKDIKGEDYKEYSPKYKLFRARKNKSTRPNLSFTGGTLAAMTPVGSEESIDIKFTHEEEAKITYYQHFAGAGKNHVIRTFFNLRPKQLKDSTLLKLLSQAIEITQVGNE